ncbi:MAG: hypothetical protein KAH25_13060, partial [Bacteroidales bacterium]|nr:hypothetical protein [Bacteroidales bacterium]
IITVIPASLGLAKGNSKEIKALDGFQDVNDFFEKEFKSAASNMGGAAYMAATVMANQLIKGAKPTNPLKPLLDAGVSIKFDAVHAAKAGVIREGLVYIIGTTAAKPKVYKGFTGANKIYKNNKNEVADSYTNKINGLLALTNGLLMGTVDKIWGGLEGLSHNNSRLPSAPTAGQIGLPTTGGLTPVQQTKLGNAVKMYKIDSLAASIFGALLGETDKKQTTLMTATPRTGAKPGPIVYQGILRLLGIDLAGTDLHALTLNIQKLGTHALAYSQAKTESDKNTAFAHFAGILKLSVANGDATAISKATAALVIFGMFTQKRDGLLYKLNEYTKKYGKQAGSEGLYLYLARI